MWHMNTETKVCTFDKSGNATEGPGSGYVCDCRHKTCACGVYNQNNSDDLLKHLALISEYSKKNVKNGTFSKNFSVEKSRIVHKLPLHTVMRGVA